MNSRMENLYGVSGECRLCGTREIHSDDSACAGLLLEKLKFSLMGNCFWEENEDPHALIQAYAESEVGREKEDGPGSGDPPGMKLTLDLDTHPGLARVLGVDRLEARVGRAARDWRKVEREVQAYEKGREAEEERLAGILKAAREELASLQGDYSSLQRLREKTPGIFEAAAASREADTLSGRLLEVGGFIRRLEEHLEGFRSKTNQVVKGIQTQGRLNSASHQAGFTGVRE